MTKIAALAGKNEQILASVNGRVIIPAQLAMKFVNYLTYISSQFKTLVKSTQQFESALLELAEALSHDSNSGMYLKFIPFIFSKCSLSIVNNLRSRIIRIQTFISWCQTSCQSIWNNC